MKPVCVLAAAGLLAAAVLVTGAGRDAAGWFVYAPGTGAGQSLLDASDWLEAPAGRSGPVHVEGERLVRGDGRPLKLWGTNICNERVAPTREEAVRWADKLARAGMNAVRFHKFTWAGAEGLGSSERSTELDPVEAARWDFFTAELGRRGIHSAWSHIYGQRVMPGDRERLLAYDEVRQAGQGHLKGSTLGLVNFAPDLQDLAIELTVKMLESRNAATGVRRAEDPGLAVVELQNEDDIFFPTTLDWVERCPTYKKLFERQFSEWLTKRYGSHEGLLKAWGARAVDAYPEYQRGERLESLNVYPIAHFWWFTPEGLDKQEVEKGTRRRLLDTALFLHDTQNAFYSRFSAAIRRTGYRGAIVGSCWQAGSGVPHYLNLRSDARLGLVDRHNYWGGGAGNHVLAPGEVESEPMVSRPGAGLLSTGFQQVANHPFSLSEWISRLPNEWIAEGPPLVAAYGLGLQGWDTSFSFASNFAGETDRVDAPNVYNADAPTQMGLSPALARMVYRGDVREGEVVALRSVSLEDLATGTLRFAEGVEQQGDAKAFSGDVPKEALAVGRVLVRFDWRSEPTRPPALAPWWTPGSKRVRSNTGQLSWDTSGRGFFTIDTPGTQGVVGFAAGQQLRLAAVSLRADTPFAVILVSSLDRVRGLGDAGRLLVTAVARARNTGMRYSADGRHLEAVGGPPIELEGVRAAIALHRAGRPTVGVLDVDGRRTGQQLPVVVAGGEARFEIDGARERTMYYEITYQDQASDDRLARRPAPRR